MSVSDFVLRISICSGREGGGCLAEFPGRLRQACGWTTLYTTVEQVSRCGANEKS